MVNVGLEPITKISEHKFTEYFHRLTPKPKSVLILMIEGKNDEEIAKQIGATEATVRKHVQNICDHFQVPSEIAGIKKNRRQELIAMTSVHLSQMSKERVLQSKKDTIDKEEIATNFTQFEAQDWGAAPDVSVFYGRSEELSKLGTWLLQDNCRLAAILGMSGMGKTTLSVKLAQQLQENFDYVVWRSLRNAPSLEKLLTDIVVFLGGKNKTIPATKTDVLISQLMEHLKENRCLIIIDNFDTILKSGDFVGHYREGYKDYGQMLRRIAEEPHQSCILLTSLEKPREVALLEGDSFPVRSLQLEGLGKDAKEILKARGLSAEERWGVLIKLYRGNPMALKMVASTIQELFDGNVADFLDISLTGIVQDIIFLVEQQFDRLSSLEKDIMYRLAVEEEAVTFIDLRNGLPVGELDLLTALKSLGERSLIEKGSGKFNLQPVVKEYVRNQLVDQVIHELEDYQKTQDLKVLQLLKSHPFNQSILEDKTKSSKGSSMFSLFRQKLLNSKEMLVFSNIPNILEEMLKNINQQESGYTKNNLQSLLTELRKA